VKGTKCPHCLVSFHPDFKRQILMSDKDGTWDALHSLCPTCAKAIIILERGKASFSKEGRHLAVEEVLLVYPKGSVRPTPPTEVPAHIAEDYAEACRVLQDSPKASAALSRRCLQSVLREAAHVNSGDLSNEIQEVIDKGGLPSHLSENIDAVRQIGNFAAHPNKSKQSGTIVPVEPGEAEWSLDILDALFDFYYVQPSVLKAKRTALNAKLQDAGKKPTKGAGKT